MLSLGNHGIKNYNKFVVEGANQLSDQMTELEHSKIGTVTDLPNNVSVQTPVGNMRSENPSPTNLHPNYLIKSQHQFNSQHLYYMYMQKQKLLNQQYLQWQLHQQRLHQYQLKQLQKISTLKDSLAINSNKRKSSDNNFDKKKKVLPSSKAGGKKEVKSKKKKKINDEKKINDKKKPKNSKNSQKTSDTTSVEVKKSSMSYSKTSPTRQGKISMLGSMTEEAHSRKNVKTSAEDIATTESSEQVENKGTIKIGDDYQADIPALSTTPKSGLDTSGKYYLTCYLDLFSTYKVYVF